MNIIKAKIINNIRLSTNYFLLELLCNTEINLGIPGQFYQIQYNNDQTKLLIPISICNIDKNMISFMVKTVGEKTKQLAEKKVNDYLNIIGPLGNGFDTKLYKNKKLFFVTGGAGFAPLFYLYNTLPNHDITWFHGGRNYDEVCFIPSYVKDINISTDDGSFMNKGYVTRFFTNYIDKLTPPTSELPTPSSQLSTLNCLACGPVPMLKTLQNICENNNIPLYVSLEEYMACGVGVCYGCALKKNDTYIRVCKEGPIFDAKEVIWT